MGKFTEAQIKEVKRALDPKNIDINKLAEDLKTTHLPIIMEAGEWRPLAQYIKDLVMASRRELVVQLILDWGTEMDMNTSAIMQNAPYWLTSRLEDQ